MYKIKDIISIDYNDLVNLTRKENREEFEGIIKQMIEVSNRRVNKLVKSNVGIYSPALKMIKNKKGDIVKFSTKGLKNKTTGQLLHEYSKLKKFLNQKTSTIKGLNETRKILQKRTGAIKLFAKEYKTKRQATYWKNKEAKFWKLYNRLVDEYGGVLTDLDSERIQKMLYQVMNQKNQAKKEEDVSLVMINYIESLYRNREFNDEEYLNSIKDEKSINNIRFEYYEMYGE